MKTLCLLFIHLYQICISPFLGSCCRFYPSCSQYAKEAIQRYGCLYGCYLSFKRILRCQPWTSKGGVDPVPIEQESSKEPLA